MAFIASASSFSGGGCSAGNISKAAVTLDKFLFRGSLQPAKHQGMPLSYSSKRPRPACAGAARAAAAAKRIRPRLTQLQIRECSSFSPASGCSVTPEQSHQAGVAEAAHSGGSAPGGPLQQKDGFMRIMKETAEEETCRSSGCVEEVQDRKADRDDMNGKDEINENGAHGSAEEAAYALVVPDEVGNGGFRRAANTVSSATTATDCLLDANEEGSSSARTAEKAPGVERSAAASADMNVPSNRETPQEVAVSQHRVSGRETTLKSVLRGAQRDTGKSYLDATEAYQAATATAAVVELASTATVALVPKSASATAAQVARTPPARAKATATVASSSPTAKSVSPAAVQCVKGLLSRPVAAPVSTPPMPPVDPEGELLSDVSELERRWRYALGDCWFEELRHELTLPYFVECLSFVRKERQKYRVFPPAHLLFNAFRITPLDKIKVIIVGQDPYHQVGQAMGLAFSVPKGIPVPPSLQNIFKEIGRNYPACDRNDIPGKSSRPLHGDLTDWAKQGVFLMNTVLTVRENSPLSHKNAGWQRFTDKVVSIINTRCDGAVFLLWGKPAQKKSSTLDRQRHLILEAGHPSPLSVRFFEGCQHFRKCNEYLSSKGKTPVVFRPCL